MLAQLQSGNLHLDASHEYPAASGLLVTPEIEPSCAEASRELRAKRERCKTAVVRCILDTGRLNGIQKKKGRVGKLPNYRCL